MAMPALPRPADYVLRVVVAACLVITGLVHLHLAHDYSHSGAKVINEAAAFRLQGVVVLVLAAALLASPMLRRVIWGVVAVVALGSLAALLISRYASTTSIPGITPEPIWTVGSKYAGLYEKEIAAIVEGIAVVLALAGAALTGGSTRRARDISPVAAVRA